MRRSSPTRFLALLLLLCATVTGAAAQSTVVANISVNAGEHERIDVPISAALSGVSLRLAEGELRLFETTGGKNLLVPSQLSGGNPDQLSWILAGTTAPRAVRTFELRVQKGAAAPAPAPASAVKVTDDGNGLQIAIGDKPVLGYRYTPMPVPDGVREVFSGSGFIHPLYSPQGEVITRIQPPDHRHHYGIENPWTHTEFEGRSVDFWNLGSGQGKVRVAGVIARSSGEVFGGFRSLHEHVDFTGPAGPKVALDEEWDVKVWNLSPERKVWIIDFASTLNPATAQPITIKAYRYQGFSMRATEKWGDQNTTLLTSEGLNKSNANSTRARWIDVNGASDVPAGHSGVLFMTNPTNFNFPEHLRIWPTGQNGGLANVYINFNPAQDRDWPLLPGHTYGLKYRMFVYDGTITAREAERLWNDYANPPRVDVRPGQGS